MIKNDRQHGKPFCQFAALRSVVEAMTGAPGMIAFVWDTAPDVDGEYVAYNPITLAWEPLGSGGAGTPAGSNTQVQYNDVGSFGADSEFTYDDVAKGLGVGDLGLMPYLVDKAMWMVGDDQSPTFFGLSYGSAKAPFVGFAKADGSGTTPTNVKDGQVIGRTRGYGYDGTAWSGTQIEIRLVADGDWSAGDHPTRIEIWTTPAGSETMVLSATISPTGLMGNNFFIDQSGSGSDTYGVLVGTIDGSNTTFRTSQGKYISGSLEVYWNGQLQTQGASNDWVETDSATGDFDFVTAPDSGIITVKYMVAQVTSNDADTVDGEHASAFASATHGHDADRLPAFHAYQSNGNPTSILAGQRGVVKCDTEEIDTGNYHDPTTGKFTPLVAGTYKISVAGALTGATAGKDVWIGIRKNGTDMRWVGLSVIATAGYGGGSGSIDVYLNGTTDYVEFVIFNGDSANRNTYTTSSSVVTWWQGHRISSTDIAGW